MREPVVRSLAPQTSRGNGPVAQEIRGSKALANRRPEAAAQRKLAEFIRTSPRLVAQAKRDAALHGEPVQCAGPKEEEKLQGKFAPAQLAAAGPEEELLQGKFAPVQRAESASGREPRANKTGLPDGLKAGVESLSGMSLDHVQVHYNSAQPAQLNALAYAQGSDIHVGPGQEQHLPHEAWHVVQQAQGRVKPTMQMKDGVPVNDDAGLEHEADVMGAKATQMRLPENPATGADDDLRSAKQLRVLQPSSAQRSARTSSRQMAGLSVSAGVIQMDGYAYGAANTTPHVHTYGTDSHLKIRTRGRTRRLNIVQNGAVHAQAQDALAAAAGNQALVTVIQGLIDDAG